MPGSNGINMSSLFKKTNNRLQTFFFNISGLLFFALVVPAASADTSFAPTKRWHTLEIGFNLGYPGRVPQQQNALDKISALGIRHIRIYEIFSCNSLLSYQNILKQALDITLKNNMIPMLSISNIPKDLQPDQKTIKKLETLLPVRVKNQVTEIMRYSNRFPPGDMQQYTMEIQKLILFLFETYGQDQVQTWWFEIGNEPDAPLYYWGTSKQFQKTADSIVKILKKNGIKNIGGFGATQHSIFPNESLSNRSHEYNRLMEKNIISADSYSFISFHMYARNNKNTQSKPLKELSDWIYLGQKKIFITEWNVSSEGAIASKTFNKKGEWGLKFIQLLVSCHQKRIDRLYLFKLMDSLLFTTNQLGAFYSNNKPKKWYNDFVSIWEVIKKGYLITSLPCGGISLQGRTGAKIIVAGSKEIQFNHNLYHLSYSSYKIKIKQNIIIPAGKWAVLKLN
jgi:hypothetical protein